MSLSLAALLAGCAGPSPKEVPAGCPVCPTPSGEKEVTTPPAKPLQAARWEDIPGWGQDDLSAALPAFLTSCRGLAGRKEWPLWRPACDEARSLNPQDGAALRRFFESRFTPYQVVNPDGSREGLITGYYEPLLHGSRRAEGSYRYPLLRVPKDLITVDLSAVYPELKHLRLRGRLQGNRVVPYWSREEMARRMDQYQALLWVDDPIELFFLQIQGSGRVQLPDGSLVRVGYGDQNGRPFQPIGRVLVERGELKPDQVSMQSIQAWARANQGQPGKVASVLNQDPSYVFFKELDLPPGDGPVGALGVPLTAERSLAVDPRTVPLGAPVFLSATYPNSSRPLQRLMLAQDTGGAIRGPVRGDFFWGFGSGAGNQAGKMKQRGQLWVFLPPGLGG